MKFKRKISIDGIDRELHFHRVEKGDEDFFIVTFQDIDGTPYAFTMGKDETGIWQVLPQRLPAWVSADWKISDTISDHLESHDTGEDRGAPYTPWDILGG